MQRKAKAKKKKKKKKQAKKKRRFKPTSIELSSLLKTEDAEYDKWRAKIGTPMFFKDKIHTYLNNVHYLQVSWSRR